MQVAKQSGKFLELVVRVEPAWIRQHPDPGTADRIRLKPDMHLPHAEGGAIGIDARNATTRGLSRLILAARRRPPAANSFFDNSLAAAVVRFTMLVIRSRTSAVHVHPGREQTRRKTGALQRRPEAVAGTGKVVADGAE